MQVSEARPPFVTWERRAVHDPVASNAIGRRVTKDVDFALIMQVGSRDQVERYADDWLDMIRQNLLNGSANAYPQEWVDGFRKAYEAFKNGHEAPLNGTSVKEWSYLSPSQAHNLISMGALTIEDVGSFTEDAMRAYGMGGRELREKAREWLSGKDSLKAENDVLKEQLKALTERLDALQLDEPVKRGRKPKDGRESTEISSSTE